jgi:hypothetical protein
LKTKYGAIYDSDEDSKGTVLTYGIPPWRVVWIDIPNILTLVHELFHAVTNICQNRQIPIIANHPNGTNGDEAAAYLLEFFLKECLKHRMIPSIEVPADPFEKGGTMAKKSMKKGGKKGSC